MDNKALIRQLKIDLITDAPNPFIEWFNGQWDNMVIHRVSEHVTIYFKSKNPELEKYQNYKQHIDAWVFLYNEEDNFFQCNYNRYWLKMREEFERISNDDVSDITKVLIDNRFNINIPEPIYKASSIP